MKRPVGRNHASRSQPAPRHDVVTGSAYATAASTPRASSQAAVDFFGAERALGSIGVRDVEACIRSPRSPQARTSGSLQRGWEPVLWAATAYSHNLHPAPSRPPWLLVGFTPRPAQRARNHGCSPGFGLCPTAPLGASHSRSSYARRSPGWQSSSRHNAASVENRIALALFVFRIERFARVIPTRSLRSVSVMPRRSSTRSSVTWIDMS